MSSHDRSLSRDELRRLRSILEDRDDALVACFDRALVVRWASRAGATGIFGRDDLEVEGIDARTFIHPDDLRSFERACARALAGDTVTWDGRASAADGSWRTVRALLWRTDSGDRLVSVTLARGGPAVYEVGSWSRSSDNELMQ